MISYRQADLLPTLQKQNEPQFHSVNIIFDVSDDSLLWGGPPYADIDSLFPPVFKEKLMSAFEGAGFIFDDDGLPYYVFEIITEEAVEQKMLHVANLLRNKKIKAKGDIEPGGYQAVLQVDVPL